MDQNKENFTFDEVCDLINQRLDNARERESDELFDYILNRKIHQDKITKKELENIFQNYKLGVDAEDLDKMLSYMTDNNDEDTEKNDELLFEENEEDEEEYKQSKKKKNKIKNESIELYYKINKEKYKEIESKFSQLQLKVKFSDDPKFLREGKLYTFKDGIFSVYDNKFFKKTNEIQLLPDIYLISAIQLNNNDLVLALKIKEEKFTTWYK